MAIQIIDGFQVNTASPIDNRIVASGSAARNDIPYKYEGLRVFDTFDSVPYVWVNNAWVSENASGIVGSGATNRIPLYTSSNVVGNSIIYQVGSNIGINTPTPGATFSVNGSLSATTLSGSGNSITGLLGYNINNGTILVGGAGSKIINGSTGQVLVSGVSNTSWSGQNQLSVGTASSSLSSLISRTTTDTSTHYLAFISSGSWFTNPVGGTSSIKANNLDLTYSPGTRTLFVGTVSSSLLTAATVSTSFLRVANGSASAPTISFNATNNTGLYRHSTQGLGVSVAGSSKATFNNDGIRLVNTSFVSLGSFSINTGSLARTNQITIAFVTYDRVIYVYSSSNSNNYYSDNGFFEIEIKIGTQQIYTIFHGTDSLGKPTGLGYSYILPAGLTSTISLYKFQLSWNSGTGPTIYATSLKFGL